MSTRTISMTDQIHEYLLSVTPPLTDVMRRLREETEALPMGMMQISVEQGQLMKLLIEMLGAKQTLEVGVFTGYSSLVVAQALPDDGQIIACDVSEEWTGIARRYWQEAGVARKIDLRLGPAAETLQDLIDAGQAGSFDFAFIDADKSNYDRYYELILKLLRPGGLIGIDNTLWGGKVADESVADADTNALRNLGRKIASDDRVTSCLVPIGDGFTLARKR
jgi:predicted O-methyltransferase YrrM